MFGVRTLGPLFRRSGLKFIFGRSGLGGFGRSGFNFRKYLIGRWGPLFGRLGFKFIFGRSGFGFQFWDVRGSDIVGPFSDVRGSNSFSDVQGSFLDVRGLDIERPFSEVRGWGLKLSGIIFGRSGFLGKGGGGGVFTIPQNYFIFTV